MRKFRIHHAGVAILAALVLAACEQGPVSGDVAAGGGQSDAVAADVILYACPDGSTVEARYPTPDRAEIIHDGQEINMVIAVSASGARYVGEGWQWWTKGMTEGTLTPLAPGEEIASAEGMLCTAE